MDNSEHQRSRKHGAFARLNGRGCYVYTLGGEVFAVFLDEEDAFEKPGVKLEVDWAGCLTEMHKVRSDVV